MKKRDVVRKLLGEQTLVPAKPVGRAFAPSNIALCKYWGKRNEELNLPITPSLSVSLGHLGTETEITMREGMDQVTLNGEPVPVRSAFARGITAYLNLLKPGRKIFFHVNTRNTIPTAAGLASSASGFAALVLALNDLFQWKLDPRNLSILARLGSGSASRSIFKGFVEWHAGADESGMDSFAEQLPLAWSALRVGLLHVSSKQKEIGSRDAMKRTRTTSALYEAWPVKATHDLILMKEALANKDFATVGSTAESNALSMHATSLGAWPPILFWLPETVALMRKIWHVREEGLPVYFTMDAGPNVKLLFLDDHEESVRASFDGIEIVKPFG